MDQDGTWHGGGPWSRPHCARWGPSFPSPKRGQRPPAKGAGASTLFLTHVYCGHGCPSQLLLSSCTNGCPKSIGGVQDCDIIFLRVVKRDSIQQREGIQKYRKQHVLNLNGSSLACTCCLLVTTLCQFKCGVAEVYVLLSAV